MVHSLGPGKSFTSLSILIISSRSEGWEDLFQNERKILTPVLVKGTEIFLPGTSSNQTATVPILPKITMTKFFNWTFVYEPVLKKMERPQCQQVYQQKPETLKYGGFVREEGNSWSANINFSTEQKLFWALKLFVFIFKKMPAYFELRFQCFKNIEIFIE